MAMGVHQAGHHRYLAQIQRLAFSGRSQITPTSDGRDAIFRDQYRPVTDRRLRDG
jgi:hypothetical protein